MGIPTIRDRCLQAIVKNALEPCWEAQFEGIATVFVQVEALMTQSTRYILLFVLIKRKNGLWMPTLKVVSITSTMNISCLASEIFPGRRLIKEWLKAGYVDNNTYHAQKAGTPQGGLISPLLANIALHGMEKALGIKYNCRGESIGKRIVVRYATTS